jgi:pyocin large subunit-like protein
VPLTSGFFDPKERHRHFISHGSDLGAANAAEYEQMADAFLGAPKPPHVGECLRKLGDMLRFDPATDTLGVLDRSPRG